MNLTHGRPQSGSCWFAARTALAIFLVSIALIYLFGGFEAVQHIR